MAYKRFEVPAPIDFAWVIRELEQLGMNRAEIARHMNVRWENVREWANGARPRHEHGEALLKLYELVSQKNATATASGPVKASPA